MTTPTDPLINSQWYIKNNGQRGGDSRLDLNVLPAWALGFNGQGIKVAINDDGMDLTHPDLIANIDATKVYDTNRDLTGQGFVTTKADAHQHGTVVGSIVGMTANDIGGVGVAYKATLIPGIAVGMLESAPANFYARLFASNITAGAHVSVNSWGDDTAFNENFGASGSAENRAWGAEVVRAATVGRDGLGMVIEVSAGNERGNRADATLSNFTNNKVVIAVAAVDQDGKVTSYSTPAASNLVAAFGGVSTEAQSNDVGFGIMAADIQGAAGYNKTEGTPGNYSYQNEGTSYSGPMVGATAALMLQANPNLGFRDVSTILAMTARQTDPTSASWLTNAASHWNLGGMHFSRDVGYGLVDIHAAVLLAQSWVPAAATAANWVKAESEAAVTLVQPIPDDASRSLTVTAQVSTNIRIDRVEFDLNLTATSPSQLKAEITSPSGTTVTLFDRPLTRELRDGVIVQDGAENAWPSTFTLTAAAFLGETSAGTWSLKLTDLVTGTEATFNSLQVRAWGSTLSTDDQYVLTNEFRGSRTLNDTAGADTLNAAAFSGALRIDLSGQTASTLGTNGTITLGSATVIENAIGGAADDVITGNSAANILRGNGGLDRLLGEGGNDRLLGHAGADTLEGGAGSDTLDGGAGDDRLTGGDGIDFGAYSGARSAYTITRDATAGTISVSSTADGSDLLAGVERLQFSDKVIGLDVDGIGGKTYRLYKAAYDRAPDAGGLGFWIYYLDNGFDMLTAANNFLNSTEFRNMYDDDPVAAGYQEPTIERFVAKVYRFALQREPEGAGYQFWVDAMYNKDGAFGKAYSRGEVLIAFAESTENKANVIGSITGGFEYTPFTG